MQTGYSDENSVCLSVCQTMASWPELAKMDRKSTIWLQRGQFDPKFQVYSLWA